MVDLMLKGMQLAIACVASWGVELWYFLGGWREFAARMRCPADDAET